LRGEFSGCDGMQCYNIAFHEINPRGWPEAQSETPNTRSTLNGILNNSRKRSQSSGFGSAAKRRVSAYGVCDERQQSCGLSWPYVPTGKFQPSSGSGRLASSTGNSHHQHCPDTVRTPGQSHPGNGATVAHAGHAAFGFDHIGESGNTLFSLNCSSFPQWSARGFGFGENL